MKNFGMLIGTEDHGIKRDLLNILDQHLGINHIQVVFLHSKKCNNNSTMQNMMT